MQKNTAYRKYHPASAALLLLSARPCRSAQDSCGPYFYKQNREEKHVWNSPKQRRACLMESFKFITPARVKLSLVPAGGILFRDFRHYSQIVQSVADIRLLDLSPIPACRHFNPQEFSQGKIFYSVSVEPPSDKTVYLDDFEPFRKTYIILGIGLHLPSARKQEKALDSLKAQYPAAIVHNIIYYKSVSLSGKNGHQETFHISEESEKIRTSIETAMCGVTRNFLVALDAYASSYETITLRSPISLKDSTVLTRTINQAQKRLSSGLSFKALFSNGQGVLPSAKDPKLKSQQRQTGRRNKLMGNFFLLAGRSHDALQYFTDAAINASKADDHLWLASALEGLAVCATILLLLGLSHQAQNPIFSAVVQLLRSKGISMMRDSSKTSMDPIVSKQSPVGNTPRNSTSSSVASGVHQPSPNTEVSQIQVIELLLLLALRCSHYYKVSIADVEDRVPDIVYIESLLRNVKLMVTIYLSSSSDSASIIEALAGFEAAKSERMGATFHLLQNRIVAEIDQVFSLQLNQLELTEQCRIYCAVASIYDDLGLHRKYGLVLRLLLEALLPQRSLIQMLAEAGGRGPLVSVKSIIELLLKIYHVDSDTEQSSSLALTHYSDWIVLQLSLIKVCLRIADAFQDYDTLTNLCVLTLSRFTHCLPVDDQVKLKDRLSWLGLISGSGEADSQIPHADPFLIRDARFIVLPQATNLVPFSVGGSSSVELAIEQRNPGFFDPFIKPAKSTSMDRVICQNEAYLLIVELQNPFDFSLDIRSMYVVAKEGFTLETVAQSLTLVSIFSLVQSQSMATTNGWKNAPKVKKAGNDLKQYSSGEGFTIPPNSAAEAKIGFMALAAGRFEIHGFHVALGDSRPQFFPIIDEEIFCGPEKLIHGSKNHSLEVPGTLEKVFLNLRMHTPGNRTGTKVVSLTSVPSQPELVTTNAQALNNWVMLLEGESQSSSLQLKNCSQIIVNHLAISLWDSTIESITSKLNLSMQQSNLNAAEIYELEWQLLENKALCVTNKAEIVSKYRVIQPGGEMKIDYDIIGKRAMTELKLILEYGNKSGDARDEVYLKKLVVPFHVSVHRSLEIIANDVIPIFAPSWKDISASMAKDASLPSQTSLGDFLDFLTRIQLSATELVSDYCLLILDIKNFWSDCLTVKIVSNMGEEREFTIAKNILPNKSSRVFIPIKRFGDKLFDKTKTIPSLRNRQFVKNDNLNEEDNRQMSQSFWAKSGLLDCLECLWFTTDSVIQRRGELDLRRLSLSPSMTDSLFQDSILIFHQVFSEETNTEVEMRSSKFVLEREKFYSLKTRIVNHTERSISGTIRHVPFPLNVSSKQDLLIDQKILYDGVLQIHVAEESLGPGQTYEKKLGFMVLEKGQYEWGCIFETLGDEGTITIGREPIYIIA